MNLDEIRFDHLYTMLRQLQLPKAGELVAAGVYFRLKPGSVSTSRVRAKDAPKR